MTCRSHSHSVTTKSTTPLLLLGIILILLIIDPLSSSSTSTRNCRCCTEAFHQRVQYHTHYSDTAAAAAARVRRYSLRDIVEQTEYEHYRVETTEIFYNDKFMLTNSNEDIIISINSIDRNEYDIASMWADSLELKIPFHKGSRTWLEQKQQQQTNEREREYQGWGI